MATQKKSQFETLLASSNKEIIANRAKLLARKSKSEAEDYVRDLKKKEQNLEIELADLQDISKSSKLSLEVVKEDFSAKTWFSDQNRVLTDLELLRVELKIALDLYKQWFGEFKEDEI